MEALWLSMNAAQACWTRKVVDLGAQLLQASVPSTTLPEGDDAWLL
jgi:hypothetical protein